MKNQNLIQKKILLAVIFILGCAKENPVSKQESLFGWAGSPDNPQIKPFDYFYMKSVGRASQKAIDRKDSAKIRKDCIDRSSNAFKDDLVFRLMSVSLHEGCTLYCGSYNESESKIQFSDFILASCASDGGDSLPEIKALYTQLRKNIKIQDTDCKPLYADDSEFVGREWRECECTVYAHIPRGRKAVWEQCIELEKKFESKR